MTAALEHFPPAALVDATMDAYARTQGAEHWAAYAARERSDTDAARLEFGAVLAAMLHVPGVEVTREWGAPIGDGRALWTGPRREIAEREARFLRGKGYEGPVALVSRWRVESPAEHHTIDVRA